MKRTLIFLSFALCLAGCKEKELVKPNALVQPNEPADQALSAQTTSTATDFTIVVMPDTQDCTGSVSDGIPAMFNTQIQWIKNNKTNLNIAYVVGVGDIVEHGDNYTNEWDIASGTTAKPGYYQLETSGIPYGLAVGNHDQTPLNSPLNDVHTNLYNQYFGISHFNNAAHPYYQSHYGGNNNSHCDFFTAGGQDFMAIYLEYDIALQDTAGMNQYAYDLCTTYASRKAIIVTHYAIVDGEQAQWGNQGASIYNKLKTRPNVFMILCGHVGGAKPEYPGEGYRENTYNGKTIRTYMADYQYRPNGGDGLLRLMKFSITNDDVTIKTFTPYNLSYGTSGYETDINSQFTKPLFGAAPTVQIAAGKYKIVPRFSEGLGKALVVSNASMANSAAIVEWDYTSAPAANDEWNFTQITNGYYRINNVNSHLDMNVAGASTATGGGIIQFPYSDDSIRNDEWALIPVDSGYYKIIARHSGLCLSVAGSLPDNGTLVKQWTYQSTPNEQFKLVAIP